VIPQEPASEVLVSWKKFLVIPKMIRLQRDAPEEVSTQWEGYWASVEQTGTHGDVVWDAESPLEAQLYLDLLRQHSDTSLPVIDAGCGNGRFTRALVDVFPFALGVDLAPSAITRAAQESRGISNVAFRSLDMTVPGAGRELTAELGEANVFVRGVFHVLDRSERRAMASNLRDLLGTRGTLLVAETNFPGSSLDYLEYLGVTPRRVPRPLERAIRAGIPRPSRFGNVELADCFPANQWHLLVTETTVIYTVPMRGLNEREALPGFLAVINTRRGIPNNPVST
jgi:SAM-dependent methyltransferase